MERYYQDDSAIVICGISGQYPGKVVLRSEEFGNPVITYVALEPERARILAENILKLLGGSHGKEETGRPKRSRKRSKR